MTSAQMCVISFSSLFMIVSNSLSKSSLLRMSAHILHYSLRFSLLSLPTFHLSASSGQTEMSGNVICVHADHIYIFCYY